MSDDIKNLLGGAFADEPPLGISRETVISKGRGQLLRRRTTITGTLAFTVVATVLGISLLSGSPPVQEASSQCPQHKAGEVSACDPSVEERLTRVLGKAGIVPPGFEVEKDGGEFVFRASGSSYQAVGRLTDAQGTAEVTVSVSAYRGRHHLCCDKRVVNGVEVYVQDMPSVVTADSVHDGTVVEVTSHTKVDTRPEKYRMRPAPALNADQVAAIAALEGLKLT